jgi:hypothetical protein
MVQVPVRKIRSPIEARINAPLDLEKAGGSSPSCTASSGADLELDWRLAEEESAWRRSGACSSDSLTRFMMERLERYN